MSTFGQSEKILAELRLDLDQFRTELKDAKKTGAKEGASIGKTVGEGLKKAAAAAIVSKVSIESLKKAYELTRDAIERIAERRGDSDPGVRAFDRIRGSATNLFDSMVQGVFASSTVQSGLSRLSQTVEGLGGEMKDIGKRFDDFVRKQTPAIASSLTLLVEVFERAGIGFKAVESTFTGLGATVSFVASKVVGFVASIIEAADNLGRAVGPANVPALTEAAESARAAQDALEALSAEQIDRAALGFGEVSAELETLPARLEAVRAQIANVLNEATSGPVARTGGLFLDDRDQEQTILTASDDLVSRIGDSFAAGLERIKGMFADLSERALGSTKTMLQGVSAAFSGLAAAASQAERAFGVSSRAAETFRRVQMGVAAAVATVRGVMSVAEASSENAQGNTGAALLHVAAAAGFFTAAGLAGAQATGFIGGSAGGAASATASREVTVDAGDTVTQRTTNITFVIEGNLIDNKDYVRNELIPTINDLVAQEDVTVNATQARRATQVGSP